MRLNPESLLFIYGTLLTGTHRPAMDRMMKRALLPVTAAIVPGRLYHLGGYPGAVPSTECGQRIHGVVVCVRHPRFCWSTLDRYEDCGRLYVREHVTALAVPGNHAMRCWIYRYCGPLHHRQPVAGGDYLGQGNRLRLSARKRRSIPRGRCGETYP